MKSRLSESAYGALQNIVTSPHHVIPSGTQSRNLLWDAAEKQVSRLRKIVRERTILLRSK